MQIYLRSYFYEDLHCFIGNKCILFHAVLDGLELFNTALVTTALFQESDY